MIHWRSPSEKPRSAWAAGSAMFTTVASSTTMSWARATVARVHHLREWATTGRRGVDAERKSCAPLYTRLGSFGYEQFLK